MPADTPHSSSEFISRLKECLKKGGGPSEVSRKSGIPLGSINHYLLGREMKLSAAVALAEACGVSLQYLATGVDDASIPRSEVRWIQKYGDALHKPARFFVLCLLLDSCQHYFIQMRRRPTLAEALEWVAAPYLAGQGFSNSYPDSLVAETFKDPEKTHINPWEAI